MGICWSEQPEKPRPTPVIVQPTAPPMQQSYISPYYNQAMSQQYTYAVKPQQVYYHYPQQQYQPPYPYQYPQYTYATVPPPRNNGISTGAAVAGGILIGSALENMMDPV